MSVMVNGAGKDSKGRTVDPWAGVLTMGPRIPVAVTIALAIVLHAGVAAAATAAVMFTDIRLWATMVQSAINARLSQEFEIEVVKPNEPPPPPPPPKEEPKEEPKPVAKEDPPPKDTPPPPPTPAEAQKVLTQDPDPKELDLTKDTVVSGSADRGPGGLTSANGTSKTPVMNPAASPTGTPGGTGTAPAPPGPPKVDRSRAAGLSGSADWSDCPFPGEADAEQIDQAFVTIQVKVAANGTPESVTVVQDPGHGFGREARKCAMRKRYTTALDVDGNPMAGTTKPFRVRFDR